MRRLVLLIFCMLLLPLPTLAVQDTYAIHVDVEQKRLTLFLGDELLRTYPIATGARDTPSPIGVFRITHRFSGQMGGFGTCFLG